MRPSTLLSLCVFVTLTLLATQARPAHSALILPLIIYKKLPKHDPTQHLKSLLQFINLDVIKGLVGQLINFEAILRHFSPPAAKTSTAASQTTVVMMMDEPRPPPETTTPTATATATSTSPPATSTTLPAFPTLPPIPVTPEMEAASPQVASTSAPTTATADPYSDSKAQDAVIPAAEAASDRDHPALGQGPPLTTAAPADTPQTEAGAP